MRSVRLQEGAIIDDVEAISLTNVELKMNQAFKTLGPPPKK